MIRSEMVLFIAKHAGVTQAKAELCMAAVLKGVSDSLASGNSVVLAGFGSFVVGRRKAREAVDPRNKNPIQIPAKKVVKFKPSLALNKKVNHG